MTYATGQKILATDFNSISWATPGIGPHWGVGTGDHGLGQSTTAFSSVAVGTKVTATQWAGLMSAVDNALKHHGTGSFTPSAVPTVGTKITYQSLLATGSVNAYNSAGSFLGSYTDSLSTPISYTGAWGNIAPYTLTFNHVLTFASGDHARYFFNSGGKVKLSFSRTGGTSNAINSSWTSICNNSSTLLIGYKNTTKSGGGGTPTILLSANNGGYWANNATTPVIHFKQYDSAGGYYYSTDFLQVSLRWSGTPSNGGYPVLNIKTELVNSSHATVDGTTTVTAVLSSPVSSYITPSWGSPGITGS